MRRSADGPAADGRSGSNFSTNGGRLSLRAKGEKEDGFAITASRTVAVPLDRLYQAFVDESLRADWLPEGQLHERTTTRPRSAHALTFRYRSSMGAASTCGAATSGPTISPFLLRSDHNLPRLSGPAALRHFVVV
jgi:hypothetical protein